jgi:hypothetical protein
MRAAPLLSLLAACAPPARSPAGAHVAVVAAPASGCALVTTLRGSAGYNGRSGDVNAADVEHYLRNQAALQGGDAIVITSRRLGARGADADSLSQPRGAAVSGGCPNCVEMAAYAYRCPSQVAAAPPVPRSAATTADQDPPFSAKAADAALSAAAESARRCRVAGGPTGEARVKVTFAGTGDVVYTEVVNDPFAGTPAGECVARKFKNARVPAFSGASRSVETAVRIEE